MNNTLLGGYRAFTTAELWNLCTLNTDKKLSLAGLRLYLAVAEMVERRTTTKKTPFYGVGELKALTGLSERSTKDGLRELKKLNLLNFTEEKVTFCSQAAIDFEENPFGTDPNRLVPIPRRLIRTLCSHTKKSEITVTLVHCARGLFLLGKRIVMKGSASSSWISRTFQIGKTTIHQTRAWLRSLGFIREQQEVQQWRKNRYGYYFEILCGKLPNRKRRNTTKNAQTGGLYKKTPFNKLKLNNQYSAPPSTNKESFSKTFFSGFSRKKNSEPTLNNIQLDDLRRLSSLLKLYEQATKAHWLVKTESSLQNFVAAAVRATRVPGDSVRIFVAIVRKAMWSNITHEQEERARGVLKKYLEKQQNPVFSVSDQVTEEEKSAAKINSLVSGLLQEIPRAYVPFER